MQPSVVLPAGVAGDTVVPMLFYGKVKSCHGTSPGVA